MRGLSEVGIACVPSRMNNGAEHTGGGPSRHSGTSRHSSTMRLAATDNGSGMGRAHCQSEQGKKACEGARINHADNTVWVDTSMKQVEGLMKLATSGVYLGGEC